LFLAITTGISQFRYAMKTVGHDAAPSVILAETIKTYLADMDAEVANELIAHPGQNQQALAAYESDRKNVTDGLVGAAENITYGDAEKTPICRIEEGLGVYEADVAAARVFHKRGGDPEVLPSYYAATAEMHSDILPAADALDKANNDVLNSAYLNLKGNAAKITAILWLSGLLLVGCLVALQLFLVKRMRRLINPLLVLATLFALGFLFYTASAYSEQVNLLKVAKEDSFDSIYPLWHARAVAYDANAAESKWLLDPSHASENANSFFTNIGLVASFGPNETFNSTADLAQQAPDSTDWQTVVPADFKGYLANEMRNITFPGEKDAVVSTMRSLGTYVAIDGQIRQLQNVGKHNDAVTLCDGSNVNQSDWAFSQFDTNLGSVITINQNQFDKAVKTADQRLPQFTWLAPIMCIAIALLALIGVLPRIQEYQ
jgi:hypothetical protein